MAEHALLSASSAHRWLVCTPSVRFGEQFPEEEPSQAALNGTDVHALAALRLHVLKGDIEPEVYDAAAEGYDDTAQGAVERYAAMVSEYLRPSDTLYIEQRVDYSEWVPEGFGTSDCIISGPNHLTIVDLKYGLHPVDPHDNPQLMLYALGALSTLVAMKDYPTTVDMIIVQPRIHNISGAQMATHDLLAWGDQFVRPRAQLAFNGEGEFAPGEHCHFCRARSYCSARAESITQSFKETNLSSNTLDAHELAEYLKQAELMQSWIDDIRTAAVREIQQGHDIPGWKLQPGRKVEAWINEQAAIDALVAYGLDIDAVAPRHPITVAQARKLAPNDIDHLVNVQHAKPTLKRMD